MFLFFHGLADRVKALFVSNAALDFEAEFLARHAERKADLLRRAALYAQEGLHPVAEELRQQAETLSLQQPLASLQPALLAWQTEAPLLALTDQLPPEPETSTPTATSSRSSSPRLPLKKKGR